jgi:hypothetical protein
MSSTSTTELLENNHRDTYLPFPNGEETEQWQITYCGLRVLKNNEDDQSEAAYRQSIYINWNKSVAILHDTSVSTANTTNFAAKFLCAIDEDLQVYFGLLQSMELHSASASLEECLDGVERMNNHLEASMHTNFEGCIHNAVWELARDLNHTQKGIERLVEARDTSSHDNFLDRSEYDRLLAELRQREHELGNCLELVEFGIWEAQEGVRKLCYAAAEFLRHSKLRNEGGIEDVCEDLEEIGDDIADHTPEIPVEEED